jgi:hypothetical protein
MKRSARAVRVRPGVERPIDEFGSVEQIAAGSPRYAAGRMSTRTTRAWRRAVDPDRHALPGEVVDKVERPNAAIRQHLRRAVHRPALTRGLRSKQRQPPGARPSLPPQETQLQASLAVDALVIRRVSVAVHERMQPTIAPAAAGAARRFSRARRTVGSSRTPEGIAWRRSPGRTELRHALGPTL